MSPPNLERVVNAVKLWIRAEYQFRLGNQAYSDETTKWYLRAERRLRRIAAGSSDLEKAAKSIGVQEMKSVERRKRHGRELSK